MNDCPNPGPELQKKYNKPVCCGCGLVLGWRGGGAPPVTVATVAKNVQEGGGAIVIGGAKEGRGGGLGHRH